MMFYTIVLFSTHFDSQRFSAQMDTILSAALCSQFGNRTAGATLTNLKNPLKMSQDDIGANEPLLTQLIKYSLATPMHPAAIRKGLIDLDLKLLGKLSGQNLQVAVCEWCRKEAILINMILNFTLPFVKRQGFSRCVSVMRLKMVYETVKSQKVEEHASDTSTMTGYDFPYHAGTQPDPAQLDADTLAIVPYVAPEGSEGYGAAGPISMEVMSSDDEAPEGVLADNSAVAPGDQIVLLSDDVDNSAEDVFADNPAVAPGDQIVLLSDDVHNAAEDVFADNGPSAPEGVFDGKTAEDLLPAWDSSWDSSCDVVTVAGVDASQGISDSTCDGTLAAALACPGVDHQSHKALRLSKKPKAKAAAKAKAALEDIRRSVPEKAKKQRKASSKTPKTPKSPKTPTTPKRKPVELKEIQASTSKHRLLFKQPVDVEDCQPEAAQPELPGFTVAEMLIARGEVQAGVIRGGLHGVERGKVVSSQQRKLWIHQIRVGQGARKEVMQVTENRFGKHGAKHLANILLCLQRRGVCFTELRALKDRWGTIML